MDTSSSPLIDLREAAQLLRVSPRWLRDRAAEFGGTRAFGRLKFFRQVILDRLQEAEQEVGLRVHLSRGAVREVSLPDQGRGQGSRGKGKGAVKAEPDKYDLLTGRHE